MFFSRIEFRKVWGNSFTPEVSKFHRTSLDSSFDSPKTRAGKLQPVFVN